MKIVLRGAAAAIALTLVVSASGQAQLLSPTYFSGIDCMLAYDATLFAFSDCSGAISGNNSGNANPGELATINHINALWNLGVTDGVDYNGGSLNGSFVLAVKGGNWFSLFWFEDQTNLTADLNAAMAGVSTNWKGTVQDPSHATVYSVPEPGVLLMLATGMLGLVAVRGREGWA